ncbi:type II secretion system protein GspD [Limnochorda pilosa]|uniref:Uncharacterized protein n=1 Tax=Limnochorda pilosa TaxID=1555112 RepID=A0A0K2SKW7_LIMPI|nr:secretin N-terminal domain-containing protein [Limnochorda pilosa]BAS27740.1 hypothetical protein LIP_1899 [Limnochorda pilosa]
MIARRSWTRLGMAAALALVLLWAVPAGAQSPGDAAGPSASPEPAARIQLSLFETDLREALNELAYQSRVNILMTPDIQGVVTAELQDVTVREALETLLAPFGYTFRWAGSFYLVGIPDPRNLAFGMLSETVAIPLYYIPADRAAALLSDFFDPYVKADPQVNRLLVTGPPEVVARVRHDVALLDRPPAEVELQVLVTELSGNAVRELGLDRLSFDSLGDLALGVETSPDAVSLSYGQVEAHIRALAQKEEATVRGNPRLRVQEGRSTTLFAGQRQFFLIASEQTTRLEEIEAGLRLELTVSRVRNGEVILSIAPSTSQVVSHMDGVPVLQSSELSTTVRLAPGETAVLASLDMAQDLATRRGTPLLSDIPLIGWLFGTRSSQEGSRQLTIFVTAKPLGADETMAPNPGGTQASPPVKGAVSGATGSVTGPTSQGAPGLAAGAATVWVGSLLLPIPRHRLLRVQYLVP